ncbi:MAG: hypothetical protein WCO42_03240 [bacterium]
MNEENKSENGGIPPRLTIKKPEQSGEAGDTVATRDSSVPPVIPEGNPVPVQDPSLAGFKKKTSRISLDQVSAEPGATLAASVSGVGVASKTIRLAPAVTGQISLPSVGKVLSGVIVSDDANRRTSRISLDSILPRTEAGTAGEDAVPKTIRVKRPTLSTPVGMPSLSVAAPTTPPLSSSAKSQTARVVVPEEVVSSESQQTQKKTIKIRRADGGGVDIKAVPRSVTIARTEGDAADQSEGEVPAPHWAFVVTASAAVVMMCVMMYALIAQVFPNLGWSLGG